MYPRPFAGYVLLERLGVGGMSEVDLARRAVEEAAYVRFLVIKRIKADRTDDDAFIRMFKDEARISAELHHGHIAQVYDFGREGDEYYLVLEYVPGLDVRRLVNLQRELGPPMPLRIALRIACDVLEGLHYAHSRTDTFGRPMDIVHRDVNPRNIMVSIRGEVKLIDFGVAKAQGRLERTRTNHVKGKFAYMSPEQVGGEDIDHRADLYAVGLTLHEMVTGYNPFVGLNQVQIMHRLLSGRVDPIESHPDLPDITPLRRVQAKALAPSIDDRYPDGASYREALEAVAKPLGGLARQDEVSAWLRALDPQVEDALREKMQRYAGRLDLAAPLVPTGIEPEREVTGTMSGSFVTRTGVVVGGGLAVVGLGTGLALVLVAAGMLLVVPGLRADADGTARGNEAGVGTVLVETPEPSVAPEPDERPPDEPVPVTEQGSAEPVLEPVVQASGSEPRRPPPEPQPVSDAPSAEAPATEQGAGTEEPEEPEAAGAEAAAEAEGREAPQPEAEHGVLQVTSQVRGRAIFVNGRDTGQVTPARVSWPSGAVEVRVEGYAAQTIELRPRQHAMVSFQ